MSKDSKLSKLKHLDLGFNRLGKGILRSLGALLTLKSLKLDYNYIGALFTSYMPFGNALLFVKFGTQLLVGLIKTILILSPSGT